MMIMDILERLFGGGPEQVALYRNAKTGIAVSTVKVPDGIKLYKTAVQHPDYTEKECGCLSLIVVETYDTEEEAKAGHDRWATKMVSDVPSTLLMVMNSRHMLPAFEAVGVTEREMTHTRHVPYDRKQIAADLAKHFKEQGA